MRDSFIFYKSFYEAVIQIPQIKYRYLLLESIIKLGLFSAETDEKPESFYDETIQKLETFCVETEQKLSKNYAVLALFLSIKPQILANYKKYLNGLKGKKYGSLGGAPQGNNNASKNNPKTTPNVNVNVNVNENENENVNENENENVNVNEDVDKTLTATDLLKNWYGEEFKNVYLTDSEYQKLLSFTLNKNVLHELIENLSQNIAEGKEKNWSEETPNIHYARLKAYWDFRRKNPDRFKKEAEQTIKSPALNWSI